MGSVGGTSAPAAYHTTLYDPIGLWQFNGSKVDASGHGLDLSLGAGTELYAALGGTRLTGAYFDGSTYFSHAFDALLQIPGAITIECLVSFPFAAAAPNSYWFAEFAGPDEDPVNNMLYSLALGSAHWSYLAEKDGGVNIPYDGGRYNIPIGVPTHLALTRSAGQVVKMYMQGTLFATSGVLDAPTDGTASILRIGSDNGGTGLLPSGTTLASMKICAIELTAAQILGECVSTIGLGR